MLFVKNVSSLLSKAMSLCDKAIKAAEKQAEVAQKKTEDLQAQIRQQGALIDAANKEKATAEAFKSKLTEFTEEATKSVK